MVTSLGVRYILRTIAVIATWAMVTTHVSTQIRTLQSFTYGDTFTLPAVSRFPTFLKYSRTSVDDLVYYDIQKSSLVLAYNEGNGEFRKTKVLASISLPTAVTVGNINNDGMDDIIIVMREQNKIVVFFSSTSDSTYSMQVFPVNYYPEKVVIGDITGDRLPDIITCGKLSAGVSVLRGTGTNRVLSAKILFPSVAVSTLSIITLNDDNIPDVVVRNWLTNDDVFFFGIGNLQFSEQTVLSYGADSTVSTFADVNNDNITDAIVTSQQLHTMLIYHGDGLGNFSRVQNIALHQNAAEIYVAKIHSRAVPDIIIRSVSGSQCSVLLNKSNGLFYDEIIFGLTANHNVFLIQDANGDRFPDIICFDRSSGNYSVLWNANTNVELIRHKKIMVGTNPSNISVNDINVDGFDDILVSNLGSHTISILHGSADRILSQISVETSDDPSNVILYSRNDTAMTLFTVHANSSTIGLIVLTAVTDTMESLIGDMEFYTIPLQGKPSYVLPDISVNNRAVAMYVFSRTQPNGISFYQQLQGTRFITKVLTPQIPSKIIFSTISDLNDDGYTDLVYVYDDNRARQDFLGATLNDERGEFSGLSYSVPIPDTGITKAFLFIDDINSDQRKDVLVYLQGLGSLSVAFGIGNGGFGTLRKVADNIFVNSVHQIAVTDFDADGINDIIYTDTLNDSIRMLKGKGNGGFFGSRDIGSIPPESVFKTGDFNGDGKSDIVYTIPAENALGIIYGK